MKAVRSALNLQAVNGVHKSSMELKEETATTTKKDFFLKNHDQPIDTMKHNKEPNLSLLPSINTMYSAYKRMRSVVLRTPIQKSLKLSEKYQANIYLKRVELVPILQEDLQVVRSYKLRGAFNKMTAIPEEDRKKGVVCSSAGNHAQGVAYVCELLKINATIFMPSSTPAIKKNAVKSWGKEFVEIIITGDTYDDSFKAAQEYCNKNGMIFVHAFDDDKIIEGQASIAIEVLEDIPEEHIDFMFFPVGGGGCGAGISSYFKQVSPKTVMVGCEPLGSPSMKLAIEQQKIEELKNINTFVDGAAIQKAGARPYQILNECLREVTLVAEGHVCTIMMEMFNEQGILVEPAGALAVGALDQYAHEIKGRTVVCLISGSNNDLGRMQDIRMLSEMHRGLQYYMLVNFYQKSGALKEFLCECLGPSDEITNIEYTRKNNREKGPALVGVKVQHPDNFELIKKKMMEIKLQFRFINPDQEIFKLLL